MYVRLITLLCALLVIFSLVNNCLAESLLLEEITVRGQQEAPQQETLTIREVRESSARDMGEALESVAGFTSVNKGAIANDVVLRGLQGDDINVFLDGVRLYGGCPSRMDPPSFHFDFAEVDSIEVIKGPYDLRNAGSLGGMINAVSKTPPQGTSATVTGTYGSYSLVNISASGSYATEKAYILAGYAYKTSDVPESGDGKLITDIYPASGMGSNRRYIPSEIDSEAYEINTFWIKGGGKVGPSEMSLNYSYQDAEHVLYPYLFMDADYDRTHRVNLTSSTTLTNSVLNEINVQAYWNQVEHLMDDKFRASAIPAPRDVSMETDSSTQVYGTKLDASAAVGVGQLDSGIDFYLRNWDATNILAAFAYAPQPMLPDVDTTNFGVFTEYSRPLGKPLKFTGGLRVDFTDVQANALDATRLSTLYQPFNQSTVSNSTDFTEFSGNLQLSWFPAEGIEVFTGLASGVRTPDAQELYIGLDRPMAMPSWVGNPNLDPTRNNQADLGVKLSGERYYLNTSVFYSQLDNFINVTRVPNNNGTMVMGTLIMASTFENIGAKMYGAEMAGQYALPADLYLRTTLSYVRGENTDTKAPLSEIPPLTGNVAIRYDNGDFFFEVSERFADGQSRVDLALDEVRTAGWAVTDVKTGVNWSNWSVTGGVNNVFDKHYFSHLSYKRDPFSSGVKVPETGLLAYLTLAYRY